METAPRALMIHRELPDRWIWRPVRRSTTSSFTAARSRYRCGFQRPHARFQHLINDVNPWNTADTMSVAARSINHMTARSRSYQVFAICDIITTPSPSAAQYEINSRTFPPPLPTIANDAATYLRALAKRIAGLSSMRVKIRIGVSRPLTLRAC